MQLCLVKVVKCTQSPALVFGRVICKRKQTSNKNLIVTQVASRSKNVINQRTVDSIHVQTSNMLFVTILAPVPIKYSMLYI